MKKIFAIALAAMLSLGLFAGCGDTESSGSGNNNNNNTKNTKPTISGVQASATVMAGEEFDALAGVTATDKEDGDLTSKITVSANGLTFTDGKTTPTEANDLMGYEIVYSVKDSGGLEAKEYCTLYVTQKANELENVYTADFTDITPGEADHHYWEAVIDGPEATATLKQGAYVFDVKNLNGAGDDKLMLRRTFNDLGAGEYEFIVWASSTADTYVHIIPEDASTDEWKPYGGEWNVKIGATVAAHSVRFTLGEGDSSSIEFRIHMGKITPNPDNPDDTTPNAFSLAIEKIALYKTTGENKEEDLFTNDFSAEGENRVYVRPDGGAEATATVADGVAKVSVAKYPDSKEVWELKADVALGGAKIEKGVTYRIYFEITAKNDQNAEAVIENGSNNDRAAFLGNLALQAGVKQSLDYTFSVGDGFKAIESDAMLRFQIGKPVDGVSDNELTIDNVRLCTITGNKKTDRVSLDKFVLFGNESSNKTNPKYPYDVFNGSDDNPANKGIGTAYLENGKLIYKIHQGSNEGGQNKIVIGYWDNPINLPANAFYVVSFKVKASAEIGMDVCLHDMDCGDSWDSGLLYRRAHFQNDPVPIGTTEQVVEFTTEVVYKASKCELILEFGSSELSKLTEDVTIEISELTIGVRRLAD